MFIKNGGHIKNIGESERINEIRISETNNYTFELWINDCLSYITIQELLELKDIIQEELKKSIK